jgi:hypothetical protein
VRRKNILNKEDDDKKNSYCQNCPYFINKLVCPFHRKKEAQERKSYDSGTTQRINE